MATFSGALGRAFDIGIGAMPTSFSSAVTGKNISMENCAGVLVLVGKTASGTTDDLAIALRECPSSAGTPRDLVTITDYWTKSETALDNDESWVKTSQTASATIAAIAGTAETQILLAFAVMAQDLSDGYTHIQVNAPDLGSTDTPTGFIMYLPFGLKIQRAPVNMPSLLAPGVANA